MSAIAEMIKTGNVEVLTKAAPAVATVYIGTIWTSIKGLIILIKDIKTWIKEFKEDDKKVEAKHFNLYRNTLIRFMDDSIKNINKLKDGVAKAKAKEEEKK